jgi:PKD domain.
MRVLYSGASSMLAALILTSSPAFGQSSVPDLSITNYQMVSEQRATLTQSYFTYRADIVNTGRARDALTATVVSRVSSVQVVSGQGSLRFSPVPANSQVTSSNTFMILVDRSVPFDFANLQWTFIAPVANAGPNQTAAVGSTVTLNGSGSTNPSGVGTLVYSWAFLSRPPGTSTKLTNATDVMATFPVDVPGTYVLKLTVSNGAGTDSATMTVSTFNSPPVANAGPNQTAVLGSTVTLNGSGSSDVDGDPITYLWSLVSRPAGSAAVLTLANSIAPTFIADKPGSYLAQLVVNDGKANSVPATVTITTLNTAPVANAGANQSVNIGTLVQLNGSGSTDVDGDPLTFQWTLITVPAGSSATLSSLTAVNPTFTADKQGTYVAQLIVADGKLNSVPATQTITTNALQPPTANAGPNQTVKHGTTVTLNGSGTDPQSLPLTLLWSMISKPAGSAAVLSSSTAANPIFVADKLGSYTVQLVVDNGTLKSTPATVTITTTNTTPVANPGAAQSVALATTVTLNGTGSSDADNDPLSYSWSFTSRPAGSAATLAAASSASPTFFADVAGQYVVQLIVNDGITNSNPATVTITAVAPNTITLTPDPLNLFNVAGNLTVTLPVPAGIGGQLIRLAVLDPGVAALPADVTIPQDAFSATVSISPVGTGSTLVSASAPGYRPGTATVNVAVPNITVTLAAGTVGLSRTINGTVTLSAPAPAGGIIVTLSGLPGGIITLQPAAVSIIGGGTTGIFTITGAAEGSATLTASSAGYNSGSAAINVGKLGQITVQSNVTVGPGQSVPLQVTLATPAPVGGVTIGLTSSDPSKASITANVFIAQGDTSPATPAQVNGINFGSTIIAASAPGFTGDSKTVTVGATLSFVPSDITIGAGGSQNVVLRLSSPAPAGGLTINLSSSNTSAATMPASVTIAQNTTDVAVLVSGVGAGSSTLTANAGTPNVANASANANVVVFGTINLPVNATVGLGASIAFPVSLSTPAPVGGITITLASSDSSKATLSITTVNIPAGSTTPVTSPQLNGVNLGSVLVSASAAGYGSTSQTVQITASLSFTPTSLTITGAATQNLTLTLSGPAPAGGVIVTVSSSNSAVATVPSTVTINQGATSATVPVTGVSAGTTVIHAGTSNIADTIANVTVQSSGSIGLQSNVTVAPGVSAVLSVTLPAPAPSNVTVSLSSGDSSKVTISPASVTILAGQTQPSLQPQVTGVSFGSAIISASAIGYSTGSQTVQSGAALSFSPASLTFVGPGTQNITLNLSSAAPAGGLVVNLSSSVPSAATIPVSVTIAQNTNSVLVPITALGAGATLITASTNAPNVTSATANITVQSLGLIGLPASAKVGLGQSLTFPVTLPSPAPAGGATIILASDNNSKVTISPATVNIAGGQTQPAVQPQITGISLGTANIGASALGYTSASQSVEVTATISFTPATLTISGIQTQNLTLTLSGPAPAGGVTINVSSSNSATATVPSTVVVLAGATTALVPVSSLAVGTTVIHASAPNLADTTANVTVTAPMDIILQADIIVPPGEQAPFPVTLAQAAADAVFITLTSSDTSKVTLSQTSIFINAGQTQPALQPKVNGISTGTVTVTASALGLQSASTTVQAGFGLTFSPASLTITGIATQNLTLVLSGPAPAGGLVVNLSSSNTAVATVPVSVIFGANSTTANVPVTGVALGTTTITASSATTASATANITVVSPGAIALPTNVTVPLSQSAAFPVTLSTPAPPGRRDGGACKQ